MPKRKNPNAPYWRQLEEAERKIIEYALAQAASIRKTAPLLGVSESFLIKRVKTLKCKKPERPESGLNKAEWKGRAKSAEAKLREKKKKADRKKKEAAAAAITPDNVVPLNPSGGNNSSSGGSSGGVT